jgi:hypothetical protein
MPDTRLWQPTYTLSRPANRGAWHSSLGSHALRPNGRVSSHHLSLSRVSPLRAFLFVLNKPETRCRCLIKSTPSSWTGTRRVIPPIPLFEVRAAAQRRISSVGFAEGNARACACGEWSRKRDTTCDYEAGRAPLPAVGCTRDGPANDVRLLLEGKYPSLPNDGKDPLSAITAASSCGARQTKRAPLSISGSGVSSERSVWLAGTFAAVGGGITNRHVCSGICTCSGGHRSQHRHGATDTAGFQSRLAV